VSIIALLRMEQIRPEQMNGQFKAGDRTLRSFGRMAQVQGFQVTSYAARERDKRDSDLTSLRISIKLQASLILYILISNVHNSQAVDCLYIVLECH
jgi:hypothetical protein